MKSNDKIVGPLSKYDRSLPYSYLAKVGMFPGGDATLQYYFSDTICGLVDYLNRKAINPDDVKLFGLYLGHEVPIEKDTCVGQGGVWLARPDICRCIEERYKISLEDRYKGHVEKGPCAFEDRDREGSGPH